MWEGVEVEGQVIDGKVVPPGIVLEGTSQETWKTRAIGFYKIQKVHNANSQFNENRTSYNRAV